MAQQGMAVFVSNDTNYINISGTYYNLSVSKNTSLAATQDRPGRIYNFYPYGSSFDFSGGIINGILQNEYQNSTYFISTQNQNPIVLLIYNDSTTAIIKYTGNMTGNGINLTEYFVFWKDLPYFYHVDNRRYLRDEFLISNNDYDILGDAPLFDTVVTENVTSEVINTSVPDSNLFTEPNDLERIRNRFEWYNFINGTYNISLGGIIVRQEPIFHSHGYNQNVVVKNGLNYWENELTGFWKKSGVMNTSDAIYNHDLYEMYFFVNNSNNSIQTSASDLFSTTSIITNETYHQAFTNGAGSYYVRAPGVWNNNSPDVNTWDAKVVGGENDITTKMAFWQIDIDGGNNINVYNSTSSKTISSTVDINDTMSYINEWENYTARIDMQVNSTNVVKYTFNITSKKNGLTISDWKGRYQRVAGNISLHWSNSSGVFNLSDISVTGNNTVWSNAPINWASFEYNVSGEPFQVIFTPQNITENAYIQRTSNKIEYWLYNNTPTTLNSGQSLIKTLYVTSAYNTTVSQIPVSPAPLSYNNYYHTYTNHSNVLFYNFNENLVPLQTNNSYLINTNVAMTIIPPSIPTKTNEVGIFNNLTIIPSSDSITVNITTWNTTGDYLKNFTITSSNTSVNFTMVICDFNVNTYQNINTNSKLLNISITNATGCLNYTYTSGNVSALIFTIEPAETNPVGYAVAIVGAATIALLYLGRTRRTQIAQYLARRKQGRRT